MKAEGKKQTVFIVILIILTACNLRASVTGVGALVSMIRDDLALSPEAAGLLTTIPLLAFAAISPLVTRLSTKLGAGRLMLFSFLVVSIGVLVRSCLGIAGVFIGTIIIGVGIAVDNVLLPAVVKVKFPHRIGSMTSLYTVVMQLASAAATASSVPLAICFGWKGALAVWCLPALLAVIFCLPNRRLQISGEDGGGETIPQKKTNQVNIYKKPMSWWVTLYMGMQSMLFYCFVTWLSSILQSRGYSEVTAGYFLSLYILMGVAGSGFLSFLMSRNRTQSTTGIQVGVLYFLGLLGMQFPDCRLLLTAGILLCGFCSGMCISFSMVLFGLHTSNGEDASRLSGMAQSIGYLLAAIGPVALGSVYHLTNHWTLPMILLTAGALFLIGAGRIVGREEII